MTKALSSALLAAFIASPFFAPARAQDEVSAGPVTHASAEDCAAIVEVGKVRLNWGPAPPPYDFNLKQKLDGEGVYLEDCPWISLGVAEPSIATPDSKNTFGITRPRYDSSGLRAMVGYGTGMQSDKTINGKRMAPFLVGYMCTLDKRDGHWHLVECKMQYIT